MVRTRSSPATRRSAASVAYAMLSVALVSACGPQAAPDGAGSSAAKQRVFSAEDRRAAKVLSIDMRQDLTAYSSPYIKNLVCETSVTRMMAMLDEMSALNAEQRSMLGSVRDAYSRNVATAARAEGKSSGDIAIDRRTQEQSSQDRGVQLQSGMACLREFLEARSSRS